MPQSSGVVIRLADLRGDCSDILFSVPFVMSNLNRRDCGFCKWNIPVAAHSLTTGRRPIVQNCI